MPVLSEHPNPSTHVGGYQATTKSSSTSNTYIFILLAMLLAFGITLSRRRCKKASHSSNNSPTNSFFTCRRKLTSAAARTMQATSPTSALPEKPYLPNADAMEGQQTMDDHEDEKTSPQELFEGSLFYSPQLLSPQNYESHENLNRQNVAVQTKSILPPPFHTRLGSLPTVTTSILHPEPPSPTITMVSKTQPAITPLNQNPYTPPHNHFHSTQSQPQYHPPTSQFQPYTQNEILFVPSPTEYTSFEALYSKFPPSSSNAPSMPIYHGENPTSYTEADFPSSSPQTYPSTSTSPGEVPTVPRRRSYIKTLSNGSEMSGEVLEAAGQWRRHTRVFGGGVCIACEESGSRRMSA